MLRCNRRHRTIIVVGVSCPSAAKRVADVSGRRISPRSVAARRIRVIRIMSRVGSGAALPAGPSLWTRAGGTEGVTAGPHQRMEDGCVGGPGGRYHHRGVQPHLPRDGDHRLPLKRRYTREDAPRNSMTGARTASRLMRSRRSIFGGKPRQTGSTARTVSRPGATPHYKLKSTASMGSFVPCSKE